MSHHGICCPNGWATAPETIELLQSLLSQPLSEVLGISDALPLGGLCDAHIIELFALAEDVQSHFDVDYANSSYIMHVWMHHLLGGKKAGLTPPTEDKRSTESKWVGSACQRLAQSDRKVRKAASQHKPSRAAGKENGSGSLDLGVPSPDSTVCLDALCSRLKQTVTARPKRKAVPLPLGECDSPPQQQAHDPPPLHPPPPQTQTQTPTLLPPTSRPRLKAPNPPTPPQPPQPMRLPAPASGSTPPAPPPSPLLLPSVPSPPPASSALDAAAVTADDTADSSRQGTAVPRRLALEFGDATGAATPSLASASASAEGPASMTPLPLPQSSTPST